MCARTKPCDDIFFLVLSAIVVCGQSGLPCGGPRYSVMYYLCDLPLLLGKSKTDEDGRAVHEECCLKKVSPKSKKPPKVVRGGMKATHGSANFSLAAVHTRSGFLL